MKKILSFIIFGVVTFQLQAQVTFTLSSSPGVGSQPQGVVSGDINGDGKMDLMCANYAANTVSVLTNNGSGGFVLAATLSSGIGISGLTAADVNGDGKMDILAGNAAPGGSAFSVFTNNGSGGFALAATLSAGSGSRPGWVAAADVNSDGRMDLISANYDANTLTVFTNNGNGGWLLAATLGAGSAPGGIAAADVNGDGKMDLISANSGDSTLSVFTNNGNAVFGLSGTYAAGYPVAVKAADVNGDGKVDLITANNNNSTINVFTNNGSGGFALRGSYPVGTQPNGIAAADVNGDGKLDFITANVGTTNTLSVMTNDGSGAFGLAATVSVGSAPGTVAAADVNGDGRVDLISGNYGANTLSVLFNTTIFPATPPSITSQPVSQAVVAGYATAFTVGAYGSQPMSYQWSINGTNLDNATNATLTLNNVQPTDAGAYAAFISNGYGQTNSTNAILTVLTVPPTIAAQPANQSVQAGGTASFTVTATGSKPFTYQWNCNGTDIADATNATLTLTNLQMSQAGNYAVSVTNAYGSTVSSNAALAVLLTLDHFAWSPIASPQAASQPFGVTLTAQNVNNVTVTNYTGALSLQASSAGVITNSGAILNGGFETGTLTNWTLVNSTYGKFITNNGTVIPPGASGALAPFAGSFSALGQETGSGVFYMYQDVTIPSGVSVATLNWAHCVRNYYSSFNSFQGFQVRICNTNNTVLATAFTTSPGNVLLGNWVQTNYNLTAYAGQKVRVMFWVDESYSYIDAYVDNVSLQLPANLPLSPTNTGNLVNGAWNGSITLTQPATNVVLLANDGSGHTASSNPFNVLALPVITAQPQNQTNLLGTTATFNVTAGGTAPYTYQWSWNGTNLIGATNSTLILPNIQLTQAGDYAVLVTNPVGATNSGAATLTVVLPPTITQQPQSLSVLSYNSAGFTVAATGTGPLTYHWRKNGTPLVDGANISGSTTTNLTLASATIGDAGNYDVVVSNAYATTNSAAAVLTLQQTVLALGSTNAMSGNTITIPVMMTAVGFENAFMGSVGYDPAKLVLQSVQPGLATAGAYLQEVDSQTNNGFVGFAILLDTGAVIPAGTQEVARLTFLALSVTNSTTANLTFGDLPTGRQVWDNNLDSMPAIYQSGSISLIPAEYAADVYPRTNGDHQVSVQDWLEVGRMVAGLDVVTNSDEMLRADCAPRNAPDAILTVADWVQAGRYALGLDPLTLVTLPVAPNLVAVPHGGQTPARTLQIASLPAQRGQIINVPVQLVCTTNENAVGMTVGYNPSQLTLLNVSLGSAIPSGRLNVNSNQLTGKVGVALALSPGASLAAGTNQVAVLRFATATNASGSATLTLDNNVARLQVADKLANALSTAYVNGAVVLPPQPVMALSSVTRSGMQLSWQLDAGTFQVQGADSLLGPWTTLVLPLTTNGANVSVTVPITTAQHLQFFRLLGQ